MKKFLVILGVIVAILTAGVLMTGCTAVGAAGLHPTAVLRHQAAMTAVVVVVVVAEQVAIFESMSLWCSG